MATTEHARHQLYRRLIDTIGPDEADTLMEFLPPSGWAEVTTKGDLHHQNELAAIQFAAIDRQFEAVDRRFEEVDRRFDIVDRKFEEIDRRFEQVDRRFEDIDRRFEQVDRRSEEVLAEMRGGFQAMAETIDLKVQSSQNLILAELHRTMRTNLIVTIAVLGTLITVMSGITAGL
ncbi:MAG: hypothetical protein U5K29_09320 [Acidimicrobiales bacterium]|nr:hypothetical protein [Acidimicrobiales bacterium]